MLLAGFLWMIFRLLAGPERVGLPVLPHHAQSARRLAGGRLWTVGYTLRWFIGLAFLVLGLHYFGNQASFDAEKIMPLVLQKLPVGMQGVFLAVLLAALMSTLSAMINVTSSVVLNDFLKRYFARQLHREAVGALGQLASAGRHRAGLRPQPAFQGRGLRVGDDDLRGGDHDPGAGHLPLALVAV